MVLAVGVDVGGTKIAAGVVDTSGRIVADSRRATPSTAADVEEAIADLVRELGATHEISAVGLGAAGLVDERRDTVLFAPNLVWRAEPLRTEVARRVQLPVVVENDANAAAWAEARFGAGRGARDMVCVTVGTGIGGGVVSDGRLFRGGFGVAAEFGHLRMVPEGLPCGCGQYGCWEQYASGRALERRARALGRSPSERTAGLLERADGDPEGITGAMVTQAAADGDPAAAGLVTELGGWLGAGLAGLSTILDPGCFVIGGGVAEIGAALLDPARDAFRRHLPAGMHRPVADIRLAALGNAAGIVGAADLARQPATAPG